MLGKARKCFKLNIKGIFIPIRTPGTQKIEQISQKKHISEKMELQQEAKLASKTFETTMSQVGQSIQGWTK